MTRAQAKAKEDLPGEKSKTKRSVKVERNLCYRKNKQKRKAEKNKPKINPSLESEFQGARSRQIEEPRLENPKPREESVPSTAESGGSVLADKHMETLEALFKAYDARLKSTKTLEQRWRRYLDPEDEARQLEINRRLIQAIQALDDKIAKPIEHKIRFEKPPQAREEEVLEKPTSIPTMQMEVPTHVPSLPDRSQKYPTSHVPKVEDEHVNDLWEEIKRAKVDARSVKSPPLELVDFDPKTLILEMKSEQVDIGSEYAIESKQGTLKTLPSFLGDDDDRSKNKKLPSHRYGPIKTLDVSNLSSLLAIPIRCTLPLADVLRVKPELWEEVATCLKKMGIELPNGEIPKLPKEMVKPKC